MKMLRKENIQYYKYVILIIGIICAFVSIFPEKSESVKNKQINKDMIYSGILKNNYFEGQGTLKIKGKGTYKGNFQNGRFCGDGKFITKDGIVYTAYFVPKDDSRKINIKINKKTWYKDNGKWKEKNN